MNPRYRKYLDSFPDPWEARYSLIGYARAHGAAAAARMSGAHLSTVYELVKQADTGALRRRPPGRAPLSTRDELRIVAARLAHPGAGPKRLKREFGLPHGTRQISRVITKHGLVPRARRRDPVRRGADAAKEVLWARAFQHLAELARARGWTGRIADAGPQRRKAERAQRAVEWWAKLADGERLPAGDEELASMVEKLRLIAEAEEARAREAEASPVLRGPKSDGDASGADPDDDRPIFRALRRLMEKYGEEKD